MQGPGCVVIALLWFVALSVLAMFCAWVADRPEDNDD